MIISKDLFIFGEQIFATIIPEIGTPNSGSSGTTATTTPPTTPISPVSLTHEHEELFQQQSQHQHQHQHQQQHQHHQQLQQNSPQHAINFNAIAEVALKVAAESVEVEVEADQQVCSIKATTPTKTGTIKPISTKATATATSRSLSASALGLASIQATTTTHETTKKNKSEEEVTIRSQIDSSAKKGKFSKPPREINKVNNNKTKRANDREREQEQEQQERINLSGRSRRRLNRKGEVEDEVIQLFENNRKQDPTIESSSFTEDEQNIEGEGEEVEQIEKEPLVKRDPPIKIINGVTLPAIAKRVQGEIDDESFCLLLSNELEAQQIRQQQQEQKQQQQQHLSNSQQTECRLQLEEPETEVLLSERFLSQVPQTLTEALSPAAKIKTTSSTATNTTTATTTPTTGNKAAMGKVVLGHNNSSSSSGSNNASTRNDHAMVTFPFITDFHRTLQLTFQSITVQHNERKILSDVSGIVSPGEVLAIMGPSGCGKTTLLDCLSGQRRIDSGSIYLNREPISKKWRRKICYVLQEEVFFSGLTLRETVMYTALLRLPEKMPNAEKVKLVDRILQTLELNCCQQTKFGDYLNRGLSGGEKKRANIACELLTNPLLMLLDEPTSGLDSHSAISLMKVLKRYAMQEQKTVVITVHQPSSQMFHMFDKLLLLYNGRTAYFGEVNNIYSYFEDIGVAIKPHYNPADFVLEQLKSYPDIREKLFVAAKESHGNFINRNCITLNAKQHHQKLHQQSTTGQTNHHNPQESNGQMKNCGQMAFNTNNTNSDKSQKHDALINNIINNYYKDITNNHHHHHHLLNHNHLNYNHHNLHHVNQDAPLLIMGGGVGGVGVGGDGGSTDDNHHDVCEDAAQQLWCATADSQSNFSSSSASSGDHQQYETDGDWLDYPTHFHTQFRVLLSRNFKEAKPLMLSKLNWLQTIGLALMAGAIWFQLPRTEEFLHDLQGWMFFSQTYWMLFALFGALNSFPAEREVISKERRSGAYRLSAYYLAKMFGELPLVITLPTVYLIISYPMLGCASFKLFFLMLVFLLLNTIVAQSVGFFIGACCMDMNVSITLSALYTLATQLFGGYLSSRIPDGLSWIRYTSMIHYAYQNMQILEFREGPTISCGSPSSFEICKNNSTSVIPYEEILKAQNSTSPLWLNTLVLMMFFLVFRVMGYAVLRYIRCPKT